MTKYIMLCLNIGYHFIPLVCLVLGMDGKEACAAEKSLVSQPYRKKMEAGLLIYGWGLLGLNVYLNYEFQQPTDMGVTDEFQ